MVDKVTSGRRGQPDVNFDFLNVVGEDIASGIAKGQQQFEVQSENLSDILSNVNTQLKETRKKKRDSDLFFTRQADQLAAKSDAVVQKTLQAAADPLNELKALFTDTPSIKEWASRHNAVQNELNTVRRRYAQGAAEYNFELTEIQQTVATAAQQRKLTQENISQAITSAQGMTTAITARSKIFDQQLNTMLLPDLKAELADPQGQVPKFLVAQRIALFEKLEADAKAARASAKGNAVKQKAAEFDLLKKHADLVPEELISTALVNEQTVVWPQTGIRIDPQTAKILQPLQSEAKEARGRLMADITMNTLQADAAVRNMSGMLARSTGPGVSVVSRDDKGQVTGFNFEALSPDAQKQLAAINELQVTIKQYENALQTAEPSEFTEFAATTVNGFRSVMQEEIAKLQETLVTEATVGMKDKEAIAATGEYVRKGQIGSPEGANSVLMENSATIVPSANTSATHGPGWGIGMQLYTQAFQDELRNQVAADPAAFEDIDEDEAFGAIVAQILSSGKNKPKMADASRNALNKTDTNRQNILQQEVLNDWYDIAAVQGIRELMAEHETEPETVKALETLLLGDMALNPQISNSPDGFSTLFATVALLERDLKASKALPEDANLTQELHMMLLRDSFYQQPEIQRLVIPQTSSAAGLNTMIFNNRAYPIFVSGMRQNIAGVPIDNLQQALVSAEQKKGLAKQPEPFQRFGTSAIVERRRREAAAGNVDQEPSLENILIQLMNQRGQ